MFDNLNMAIVDNFDDYQNTENSAYFELETNILMLHFLWDGRGSSGNLMPNGTYIISVRNENGEKDFQKVVIMRN